MNSTLRSILRCPTCHGQLQFGSAHIGCAACQATFAIDNDVPIFTAEESRKLAGGTTNPLGAEFERVLQEGREFILNIGAGGTPQRYSKCIQFDGTIFRHTDVIGETDQLPFADAVFDRVFAFNVFEHLREPRRAAAEILRVLKPGGAVAIHTAFLQALHESPHHFFNATEFGVREWFADFEIDRCDASGNFGPGVMLGFLLTSVMEAARSAGATWKELAELENTTIGEWCEFWAGKAPQPPGFTMLQNLPQEFQKRVSAGFELRARKPA